MVNKVNWHDKDTARWCPHPHPCTQFLPPSSPRNCNDSHLINAFKLGTLASANVFFTSIIFCDRHANKSYDIFKTFGDREVICWGSGHSQNTWYAHGIFDIEELEDKNFFFINSICQQYSGVWVLKGVLKGRKGLKLLSNKRFLPFCPWLSTLVILISQQAFSVFSSFLDFSTVKEKNNRISCYVNSHMFFSRMVNQFWRV